LRLENGNTKVGNRGLIEKLNKNDEKGIEKLKFNSTLLEKKLLLWLQPFLLVLFDV
jgi:hypothetical protein